MSSPRVTGRSGSVNKGRPSTIFVGWAALFCLGAYAFLEIKARNRASGQRFMAEYKAGQMDGKDADEQAAQIAAMQALREKEDAAQSPLKTIVAAVKAQAKNLSFSSGQ